MLWGEDSKLSGGRVATFAAAKRSGSNSIRAAAVSFSWAKRLLRISVSPGGVLAVVFTSCRG